MVTMTHKNKDIGPKIALYEPDIPQNTASIIKNLLMSRSRFSKLLSHVVFCLLIKDLKGLLWTIWSLIESNFTKVLMNF